MEAISFLASSFMNRQREDAWCFHALPIIHKFKKARKADKNQKDFEKYLFFLL